MGFDKSSAQIVQPIIDAIQEFKVQTSTFSAEFGQAAGGVVNVTMKSGTNSLHGNLFEFLRNSRMDATPYFQARARPNRCSSRTSSEPPSAGPSSRTGPSSSEAGRARAR